MEKKTIEERLEEAREQYRKLQDEMCELEKEYRETYKGNIEALRKEAVGKFFEEEHSAESKSYVYVKDIVQCTYTAIQCNYYIVNGCNITQRSDGTFFLASQFTMTFTEDLQPYRGRKISKHEFLEKTSCLSELLSFMK